MTNISYSLSAAPGILRISRLYPLRNCSDSNILPARLLKMHVLHVPFHDSTPAGQNRGFHFCTTPGYHLAPLQRSISVRGTYSSCVPYRCRLKTDQIALSQECV